MKRICGIVFFTAFGLGACANVQPYEKPIADFSTATDSAAQAVHELDSRAAKRVSEIAIAEAIKAPGHIKHSDDDCTTNSEHCVLTIGIKIQGGSGQIVSLPLSSTTLLPNSVKIMTGIQAYAKALDSIAKADSSADVKAGLGGAIGAVASFASITGVGPGAVLQALKQPLTDTGVWIFQQYQSEMKLEALKRATSSADPVIAKAMDILTDEMLIEKKSRTAYLESVLSEKMGAIENTQTPNPSQIKDLVASANQLDNALSVNSTGLFDKLKTAHQELTKALAEPEPDFGQAIAAVQNLLTGAETVEKLIAAYDTAAQTAAAKPSTP